MQRDVAKLLVYDSSSKLQTPNKFPPRTQTTALVGPRWQLIPASQPYIDQNTYLPSSFNHVMPYIEQHYVRPHQDQHCHTYYNLPRRNAFQPDQTCQGPIYDSPLSLVWPDESIQMTYDDDELPPTPVSSISALPEQHFQSFNYNQKEMQLINSKFTVEFLARMKAKSSSRSNFVTNLVWELFDENISSKLKYFWEKDQLDPAKIADIKWTKFHVSTGIWREQRIGLEEVPRSYWWELLPLMKKINHVFAIK